MRVLILICFIFLAGCTSTKKVLICGDHKCVNNDEAEEYFKENLTIEVRIINKDNKINTYDLVELNMKESDESQKKIKLLNVNKSKKLTKLSNKEKKKIKKNIKLKKKKNNMIEDVNSNPVAKLKTKVEPQKKDKTKEKFVNFDDIKPQKKRIYQNDICLILPKCDINEISKYLIKKSKEKNYPDITSNE